MQAMIKNYSNDGGLVLLAEKHYQIYHFFFVLLTFEVPCFLIFFMKF